jgi:hypothetical protein
LAGDTEEAVRGEVARNPNTPLAVLQELAGDSENWVRQWVALNPNTPPDALGMLALDEDYSVQTFAMIALDFRDKTQPIGSVSRRRNPTLA